MWHVCLLVHPPISYFPSLSERVTYWCDLLGPCKYMRFWMLGKYAVPPLHVIIFCSEYIVIANMGLIYLKVVMHIWYSITSLSEVCQVWGMSTFKCNGFASTTFLSRSFLWAKVLSDLPHHVSFSPGGLGFLCQNIGDYITFTKFSIKTKETLKSKHMVVRRDYTFKEGIFFLFFCFKFKINTYFFQFYLQYVKSLGVAAPIFIATKNSNKLKNPWLFLKLIRECKS